jgi:hypothetical protein
MSTTDLPVVLFRVFAALVAEPRSAAVAVGKMKPLSDATGPEKVVRLMVISSHAS